MLIQVFGPGCAKCAETEKLVREVVEKNQIDAKVEKISDLRQMMTAGVLSTPAVAVDGVLKMSGRVPSKIDILAWLNQDTA